MFNCDAAGSRIAVSAAVAAPRRHIIPTRPDVPMKRTQLFISPILSGMVLATFVSAGMAQSSGQPEVVPAVEPGTKLSMPAAGTLAPDFTVLAPDGSEISLSDYRGSIVVVDFWATWCGPCQQAMPHNNDMYEKYRDDGVVVLAVCSNDTREAYDGWVKRNSRKYSFLTAFDPAGRDYDNSFVRNVYGVTGFPTMFVIGRDGHIVGAASGGGPGENPRLARLLAKAGAPIDLASLPPEEERTGPASVPMLGKTPAKKTTGLIGMGAPKSDGGPARFGTLELGQVVPDFSAVGEDGSQTKLSDYAGRTVLVHFFTGANPQPYMQDIASKYGEAGVTVLGISTATEKADFDAWVKGGKSGVTYPVAWDPVGRAFMESAAYMVFGIGMFPGSVVVDTQGKLVDGVIGMGGVAEQKVYAMLAKAGVKLQAADRPLPPMSSFGKLKIGDEVPDFAAIGPDGQPVKLADFKGRTVVLDFWATWCGPCQKAMPHYQDIHSRYGGDNVVVLGICAYDTRENYDKWLAEHQGEYTFATAFDPAGKPARPEEYAATIAQSAFGTTFMLPTTGVIGPDGRLVGGYAGYSERTTEMLATLLMRAGVKLQEQDRPRFAAAQASGASGVPGGR